eukprot:evm.model.NODE_14293_length_7935_cov_37.854694.2
MLKEGGRKDQPPPPPLLLLLLLVVVVVVVVVVVIFVFGPVQVEEFWKGSNAADAVLDEEEVEENEEGRKV